MWLTRRLTPTYRRLPISARTTALRSASVPRFVGLSARWACLRMPASRSTEQVQGGQQSRQELVAARQDGPAHGADRGEHQRYLASQLDTADRQEPSEALKTKTSRLKEKIEKLKEEMRRLEILKVQMLATPDQQISLTDPEFPLDGDQRPPLRRRRLQRANGCRYRRII